jgi:hypothetical protein
VRCSCNFICFYYSTFFIIYYVIYQFLTEIVSFLMAHLNSFHKTGGIKNRIHKSVAIVESYHGGATIRSAMFSFQNTELFFIH